MSRKTRIKADVLDNLDAFLPSLSPRKSAIIDQYGRNFVLVDSTFEGASRYRRALKSWFPGLGSANTDLNTGTRQNLISRSRDAYRNQPLARAPILRTISNSVGTGLTLQSQPDWKILGITAEQADEIGDTIEREFNVYAASREIDAERTLNFNGLQTLAMASALISGDTIAATPWIERPGAIYGTKIQIIEADRLRNKDNAPNTQTLFDGVEYDENGAPVNYHVSRGHPGDTLGQTQALQWDILPAFGAKTGRRRTLHVFWKERPGQSRGMPFITPILETLRQIKNYSDNELMATVISSLLTVFIKTEGGELNLGMSSPAPNLNGNILKDDAPEMTLGNGKIIELMPGESIETVNPNRPNSVFEQFINAFCAYAGAALEIPVDVLLLRFQSSYSAARAALLQAWKFFMTRRDWLAFMFCQPMFELILDEMVARGRVKLANYNDPTMRAAWAKADWYGPEKGEIDELKSATAAEKRIEIGISSVAVESAKIGVDAEAIHVQRVKEKARRVAAGLEATTKPKEATAATPSDPNADNPDAADNAEKQGNQ